MELIHGGQLNAVAAQFGLDKDNWLDLSTGISPFSYPVPQIPNAVWRELPQQDQQLLIVAKAYYEAEQIMVTSGSQSVIQVLPKIWNKKKPEETLVLLPAIGYKEHEKAWRTHGYIIRHYHELPEPETLTQNMILVVINPNNPSGELVTRKQLNKIKDRLMALDGWLIVDEAFMDAYEESQSVAKSTGEDGVFVLKSIGKFFGLAGIRVGFVCCHQKWLSLLQENFGPWQVNGPALYITTKALADKSWHQYQKKRLLQQSQKLNKLLSDFFTRKMAFGNIDIVATSLFITVRLDAAENIYQQLCQNKIYVRLCDDGESLRFGIPDNSGIETLARVLPLIKIDNCAV